MSIFDKYELIDVDERFPIPKIPSSGLVLLVGSSGSGKSTILREWLGESNLEFKDGPIYESFSTEESAEKHLIACGLRTIPAWKRSINNLSNGEAHRAFCALALDEGCSFIDEFTSVVDRNTAKSLSYSIQKHFKESKTKRLVVATCHRDVREWLDPDYVYDTDLKEWEESELLPRGLLRRPSISLQIQPVEGKSFWNLFKRHHYLNSGFNSSAASFGAFMGEKPVGFCSVLRFPNAHFSNAWREHRTVVLPEFQGLGIGTKVSESIGELIIDFGGRFFSKTSHPAFVRSRNKSKKWRATTKNGKSRKDYLISKTKTKEDGHKMRHAKRVCGSHEYIGNAGGAIA